MEPSVTFHSVGPDISFPNPGSLGLATLNVGKPADDMAVSDLNAGTVTIELAQGNFNFNTGQVINVADPGTDRGPPRLLPMPTSLSES